MGTWIVVDPDALSQYYGQHFHQNALPPLHNLEDKSQATIAKALTRATQRTRKREYHKIRHAQYDPQAHQSTVCTQVVSQL